MLKFMPKIVHNKFEKYNNTSLETSETNNATRSLL